MKHLIVLSAVPGAGKSTWASRYKETHSDAIIVSSDDIRFELTGQYQDFSKQKLVWETVSSRVIELSNMNNVTVILDAVIDLNYLRKQYAEVEGKDYDKKTLVVIVKPIETIEKTNKERNVEKWVPDDILVKLYHKFELPTQEIIELYDEYVFIDKYFE
ncbi:MAG: AAA family ATPase [Bacilli bacterium]